MIPVVGSGIHEFLMATAFDYRDEFPPAKNNQPYLERLDKAFKADGFFLRAIRSINAKAPRSLLYKSYKLLLKGNADEVGVDINETISYLEAKKASDLFRNNPPKPDLVF